MTSPVNDNMGDTPDHGASAVVSLTDARERRELDETLMEMVRELARAAADAHYDSVIRGVNL